VIRKPGKRSARLFLPPVAIACALAIAGCDLHDNADLVNGQQLFTERCGSCHVLVRAGTEGKIGPSLDAAFRQARADGMGEATVKGVVAQQIGFPRQTEPGLPDYMPANLVEGQDADDVATFVARWAGLEGVEPAPIGGGTPEQLFATKCGACHTLAAAGASGTVGPNLDDVLAGQSADQVMESIANPDAAKSPGFESATMPQITLQPDELKELVQFLLDSVK